jgi:CubicO group peptidase (beta-lactamase class C family)
MRKMMGLAAILVALTAQTALTAPSRPAVRVAGEDAAAVAETRTYLERLEKLGFAGVVLVARGDTPLLAEGYGLADRERGLRWTPGTAASTGSITKQFTGAAILALEENGKLSVNDALAKYFDGVPSDKAAITLHQLLTHSSGLSDPPDIGDYVPVPRDEFVRRVLALPLLFEPGRGYEYANANFSLLGAIIEKLSGLSYEEFIRERLFLPNGMYETGYILPQWGPGREAQGYVDGKLWGTIMSRPMASDGPHWALRANGGIQTTAFDMMRWGRALLEGRVLSAASMDKLWSPYVDERGGTFYGYGWSIAKAPDGTKIVTHNGSNGIFFADLAIVPDEDLVVYLMTNVAAETRVANTLLRKIAMRIQAGEPLPAIPAIVDVAPAGLDAAVGTYRLPGKDGAFRLSVETGGRDGKPALHIEADGERAFAILNSVGTAPAGRLEKLTGATRAIVASNMKGDFRPVFKAYGGEVTLERLKKGWAQAIGELEAEVGKVVGYEALGTARTDDRDETVVRFYGEKGVIDWTYVWDSEQVGRLLGRSERGLAVKLRLYASGEREFFTWDGGIRPPKSVRFETTGDGRLALHLEGHIGVRPQEVE